MAAQLHRQRFAGNRSSSSLAVASRRAGRVGEEGGRRRLDLRGDWDEKTLDGDRLVFRAGVGRGKLAEVPAFLFTEWIAGKSNLSVPELSFGLYLRHSRLTDAGLSELARFQLLQALDISSCSVTDEGLKRSTVSGNCKCSICRRPGSATPA